MSSIETLATYLADHVTAAPVLPLLHLHLADTLAAWAAGATTAEGRLLIAHRRALPSDDIGADIALRTALARLSEVDDIHLASMTTPGSIVVPAALTIAATLPGTSSATIARSIVAGYEAMIRLGLAIDGPSVLYRGIWPTLYAAPFGTAALAAQLMRLDAGQTAHALALALTLASPGVGHHNAGTTSRWFAAGHAARNGWHAALAAQSGFTADLGLLDGAFFKGVFQLSPDASALTRDLGARSMLTEVSFKPWCGARQTMAAVQAVREIIADGVAPGAISSITARVLPPHLEMIDHGVAAGNRASHLTSLPYQIALAVLAPQTMDDIGQSPDKIASDVSALIQRIKLEPDDSLLAGYPRAWAAKVVVSAGDATYERQVSAVPGDPGRPWGDADVQAKLARYIAPLAGESGAEALFACSSDVLSGSKGAASVLERMQAIVSNAAISRPAG